MKIQKLLQQAFALFKSTKYNDFETRVNKILSMDYEEYLAEIKDIKKIYNMSINALDFLK